MSRPEEKISAGWGARLKLARTRMNMTQEQLAGIMGVVKATVGRWELERHPVASATWPTLAGVLGVRREWLQFGIEPMIQTLVRPPQKKSELQGIADNISALVKNIPNSSDPNVISGSRSLAVYVLNNCLTELSEKFGEMTDDQAVYIANAIRTALEDVLNYKV